MPFSRNLADKETKKQRNKERKKSSENNTPLPVPTGGGVIIEFMFKMTNVKTVSKQTVSYCKVALPRMVA